jgi:hypothetical protein
MSESSPEEHDPTAEEARLHAQEEGARAKEEAKALAARVAASALEGEAGEEAVRQQGAIYGGLIGIAVIMLQPFLGARSLDTPAKISVIAFAVAIPLLAALVMVNRQEAFRRRRTSSRSVTVAQVMGQGTAFAGLVAGFWHISWIAGVVFLGAGFVGMLVHAAGWVRLEVNRTPSAAGQP